MGECGSKRVRVFGSVGVGESEDGGRETSNIEHPTSNIQHRMFPTLGKNGGELCPQITQICADEEINDAAE